MTGLVSRPPTLRRPAGHCTDAAARSSKLATTGAADVPDRYEINPMPPVACNAAVEQFGDSREKR